MKAKNERGMTYPVHLHIWINDLMIGFRGRMRDEKRGQGEGGWSCSG